ncbi:MAG: agmatine deiminase family protein [Bacteroidota bacterium]
MSTNFEILSHATNASGEPYSVIKVPHTDPKTELLLVNDEWSAESLEYFDLVVGDTVFFAYASSYLNYLITNEVEIIPQYGNENGPISKKDQDVRSIFEELYPNREIIGLNPLYLNNDGGGMHCRFQTQPKLK